MRAPTTRAELQAASPAQPVRTLRDLPESENVWAAPADYGQLYGQLVHYKAGHKVAVCGAAISEWASSAGHMVVLGGRLCPACWTTETPAGSEPAGDGKETRQ